MDLKRIKKIFTTSHYIYLFFIWFVVFFALNFYLNELELVGFRIFSYQTSIISFYLFFLFVNSILIAVNINLIILRFNEVKSFSSKNTFFSGIGTFFALIAGGCPGCIGGFFPVIVGVFGSSFALTQLPFYGIEIQAISTILLLIGIYFMSENISCSVKKKKKNGKKNN